MDSLKYTKIAEVNGHMQAEFFKSFLEAQGIDVQLFEESFAQSSYVSPLAMVQVFVPKERAEEAHQLLASYEEFQPEQEDEEGEDEA
jgi:hypothetical protein